MLNSGSCRNPNRHHAKATRIFESHNWPKLDTIFDQLRKACMETYGCNLTTRINQSVLIRSNRPTPELNNFQPFWVLVDLIEYIEPTIKLRCHVYADRVYDEISQIDLGKTCLWQLHYHVMFRSIWGTHFNEAENPLSSGGFGAIPRLFPSPIK